MVLLGILIGIIFFQPIQQYVSIPNQLTLFQGQVKDVLSSSSALSEVTGDADEAVASVNEQNGLSITGKTSGDTDVTLKMNGFPIKRMNVDVMNDIRVVPGGQSIGVELNSVGVMVVGYHPIHTKKGKVSPAEEAGIQVGDIITEINGEKVQKMEEVGGLINKAGKNGKTLDMTLLRDKKKLQKQIKPQKDKETADYQMGLYIRDSAAGIGTLTFYDPDSMKYGALGHVISDQDTEKPIKVNDGKIMGSTVTSIEKGSNGHPGEKIAKFQRSKRETLGTVSENSPFGIFGRLNQIPKRSVTDETVPVALSSEVEKGPAKIYTVVEGNKVEAFDVKIVSSSPQKFPTTKGLVIKITDDKLLDTTGGIVQGMSGSPIIQNGKLIGAVTHVFVNDSTTGYGVHIEWMLDEAGFDIFDGKKKRMAS